MILTEGSKYFSTDQIKDFFSYCKENSRITPEEYDQFVRELTMLPAEIIERLSSEAHFILLSKSTGNSGVCLWTKDYQVHKALIVLTPDYFDCADWVALHETAHFIKNHSARTVEEYLIQEKEAQAQVLEWMHAHDAYQAGLKKKTV